MELITSEQALQELDIKQIKIYNWESLIDFVRHLEPTHNLRVIQVGDAVTFEMSHQDYEEAKRNFEADHYEPDPYDYDSIG